MPGTDDNSSADPAPAQTQPTNRFGKAERDLLALGIAITATVLFVGTSSSALTQVIHQIKGIGLGPDLLLTNALLLNVALVIFGWRRYDELCIEVRQRRSAEARARQLAETDPMTGALNRRSIGPATDALITACAARGEVAAFVMIDIDHFKQINDFNGHAVGDRILVECARRIRAALPEEALMARLGGDEFACVIPFATHAPERIDHVAGQIIDLIAAPITVDDFNGEVTASVGITRSDRQNRLGTGPADAAGLLHMADIAMYNAKKQGRNRYFWFENAMESELRYRSEMEVGVRQGIARGEFVPYYQPQVDMGTGRVLGFEMLARWHSPVFGVVEPDAFIPIAEEIGVIAELSEGLIARALEDARGWDPSLTLSVNISPVQLRDPWFAQKLLKLLTASTFPANRLEIEITETCLHQNVAMVSTLITSLKNQGISVSLDDFGTGYSSLSQLRKLPFDRIKIDRSFVTALPRDDDSQTIVSTIAALGAGLGMPITAEGVEDEAVLAQLAQIGSFRAQGYHFGRPVDAAKTRDLLAAQGLLVAAHGDTHLAAQGEAPDAPAPAIAPEPAATPQRRSA
ncbi:EAL domain-containing protein [Novosphingobium sp. FSY-8]|uniref:EAL domain-containing protein n=1 Tax=Novosphingobium ovatum TaxID=1908523 RepID=A0ABW9XCX2_9SPHN|nr:EAL domain-containing protein [Novosphingobium ovatum]NBC36398.1 EAL domain-containing protein [Novosphingobium ovatum]